MATKLLAAMRDIEGLDPIGYWPLAIGWWLIIIIVSSSIMGALLYYLRCKKYQRSWLYSAHQELLLLEKSIGTVSAKQIITALSALLRQIAVHKYPRVDCASISSIAWLTWLKEHDPKQFDWLNYGAVLIQGPYSPNDQNICMADVQQLLQAAKRWVK